MQVSRIRRMLHVVLVLIGISFALSGQATVSEVNPLQPPFNRGVSLDTWMSTSELGRLDINQFNLNDLQQLHSLGFDFVRLPLSGLVFTDGKDFAFNPVFLKLLDHALDLIEQAGLKVVLDNHSIPLPSNAIMERFLLRFWDQIAHRYKGRSDFLIYEILNEPHDIDAKTWYAIQGRVVKAIRAIDPDRKIVVTGADWGGMDGLFKFPPYADSKLIYSFHFYDPMLFTHQGATWSEPTLAKVAGIPFPFDKARMPPKPVMASRDWVNQLWDRYSNEGAADYLRHSIAEAGRWGLKNKVALWCGEFGVFELHSLPADRASWFGTVRQALESWGISWSVWNYREAFGLFVKDSQRTFPGDLDPQVIAALGLQQPPAQTRGADVSTPVGPVVFYDGFPGEVGSLVHWGAGQVSTFDRDPVATDKFVVTIRDFQRYGNVEWHFRTPLNLVDWMASEGAEPSGRLEIQLAAKGKPVDLTLRFVMPATGDSLPWRADYTIPAKQLHWDGNFQQLSLVLADFKDMGAFDGSWHVSEGKFRWTKLQSFFIVAENSDWAGATLSIRRLILQPGK